MEYGGPSAGGFLIQSIYLAQLVVNQTKPLLVLAHDSDSSSVTYGGPGAGGVPAPIHLSDQLPVCNLFNQPSYETNAARLYCNCNHRFGSKWFHSLVDAPKMGFGGETNFVVTDLFTPSTVAALVV